MDKRTLDIMLNGKHIILTFLITKSISVSILHVYLLLTLAVPFWSFLSFPGGNSIIEPFDKFIYRVKSVAQVQIEYSYTFKDRQGKPIPIIKVTSLNNKDLEKASALIMAVLDPHRDKMTFNIDVPYNDHSYIIGKDGSRIKQLSSETKCHIHLPDCNKTDQATKSNKLSIAGTSFDAIEKARSQIRKSLPLNIRFKAMVESSKFMRIDTSTSEVQAIKRKYRVDVTFTDVYSNAKYTEVTINVKGGRSQSGDIKNAAHDLYQFITGEDMFANPNIVFSISIDISHAHHQFVKGKGNCNMNCIKNRNNSDIIFPENPNVNKVIVENTDIGSTVFGWQELMGYLPLLLSFDVNFDITKYKDEVERIEKEESVGIRIREKLSGHVYTVLVKTQERNSIRLKEIRQYILDINPNSSSNSAVSTRINPSYKKDRFSVYAKPFTPLKSINYSNYNNNNNYNNYFTTVSNVNSNIFSPDYPGTDYDMRSHTSLSSQVNYSFSDRFSYFEHPKLVSDLCDSGEYNSGYLNSTPLSDVSNLWMTPYSRKNIR